ncbi:ABC transporter substrate-binding protein [Bacillus sp. FSL W8-0223]|uniref:ABC transporter substrate-binding protein n=1 Tax=Bacillus sp. FSL W8-0223 TaxID=2954595 RepID=UPI0030F4B98F
MTLTDHNKKKRFLKGLTQIFILSFLVVGIVGCSNDAQSTIASKYSIKSSLDPSVLRIGFVGSSKDNIPTGVEGWAIHKKLLQQELKKKGIEKLEFHAFPNGPPLNEAMAAGDLDIGILGDTPAIVGKSNGLKTKLIGQTSINSNVWLITPKNGVKSVEELKGKTVATQLGSYMYRYLTGLLKAKRLDKEVKIVNMAASDAEAALERKDIAAYAFPTNSGPLMKSKGFPVIDEAKDHPELLGSSVAVITENYLSKHPELPKIWNNVRKRALEDVLKNPEDFYQFQSEQVGYPVKVMKDSLPLNNLKSESVSKEGEKLLANTKKFLVEEKFAKKDFNLKDWIVK